VVLLPSIPWPHVHGHTPQYASRVHSNLITKCSLITLPCRIITSYIFPLFSLILLTIFVAYLSVPQMYKYRPAPHWDIRSSKHQCISSPLSISLTCDFSFLSLFSVRSASIWRHHYQPTTLFTDPYISFPHQHLTSSRTFRNYTNPPAVVRLTTVNPPPHLHSIVRLVLGIAQVLFVIPPSYQTHR